MVLKELFESGYDFEQEFNQSDLAYQEKSNEYRANMEITEETINKIKSIEKEINILGFSELWCPDCQINLTVIDYLTKLNPNIKLRLQTREGNEEIIKTHSDDGKIKIPIFIYLDSNFKKIGSFIELPSNVRTIDMADNQVEKIKIKKLYRKGSYMEQTIIDFLEIIN
ncbi:MAG: thioredoxin family protein [Paraclostridium sp.]|uniref:thioredoxin family protein n=1 Tax=Paraclostridium sp. TaxID=2023273 RepID=UPI003F3ACA13